MAQLTKAQLEAQNQSDFPNNNAGLITPQILREYNTDVIDSLVDEVSYNIDSASFSGSIAQLQQFSSSLDATFATDAQLSASVSSLSASIAVTDLAQSSSIAALQQFSSSLDATFATDAQLSASVSALSSSIAVTDLAQSASIAQLQQFSSSLDSGFVSEAEFGAYSSSINSYTASNDSKVNSLINKTGSYATTGSNTFNGNQNIVGAVTASSARIANLAYPTADGTFTGQVLQTNAAGTLSFGNVNAIFETIRNGEATSITVGTPLYVSGSQGDQPIVYRADATNPAKMPVTFVAFETIAAGQSGRGVTLGLITGINMSGYSAGDALYVDGLGVLTNIRPTGSNDIVQPIGIVTKPGNGGQLNVLNPGPVLLPNLKTDFVWVGDSTNQPVTRSLSNLGLALTGSNNTFGGTQTFNNLTVNGTASFAYTSTTTGSAVIIGEEYIILNNDTPTAPYAGLKIYDSGSLNSTASFLWDGVNNHWVYETPSGSGYGAAGFLSGPTGSSLNSIIYPTLNRLVKGGGSDHLYDSNVSDDGTNVRITTNTIVTGSVTATNGFIGNATSATTASYVETASFATNAFSATSASFASFASTAGTATTASFVESASFAVNAGLLDGKDSTEFATTSSNSFKGIQYVSASVYVRNGDIFNISNNTTVEPDLYLTESLAGQVNIIKGWSENPASAGPGASQANYTGSLRITGSNNTISLPQIRATAVGAGADSQGYISGSDNIIAGNFAGIYLNTGSQLFPKTQNNQLSQNSYISMNFTTSSLSGGHPTISNGIINNSGLTINHNSGSVSAASNILNGAFVTSTQNFVTNTRPSISTNIGTAQTVTLNHISSSINYQGNIFNSGVTINNHLSSSGLSTNNFNFTNNVVFGGSSGTGLGVWVSGSQSSNIARLFSDSLIGGRNIIVSSSFVSSSNANLISSLVVGNGLTVSASHSTGTNGGSTFLGRFNDSGSLALAQDIVFAVGTGTSTSARRTGMWIDSGSNAVISGSFRTIGNAAFTGSVDVTGSQVTLQNAGAIALAVRSGSVEVTSPQGTGYFYTNLPLTSSAARINGTALVSDLIVSGVFSGNSSLQVFGNASVTGSTTLGNLTVSGSTILTGSIVGNVVSQSYSSNTASFNLNNGNFFNLTLPDALTQPSTQLELTNLKAGQTVNVRMNLANGVGALTFGSNIRQVSGSTYVPSTTQTTDVLTFVTFDTGSAYLVAVKNLV